MKTTVITEIRSVLSMDELREMSGLPRELFDELAEIGVTDDFFNADRTGYVSDSFVYFRRAARLLNTFDLNADALALMIRYMEEIERLKRTLNGMRVGRLTNSF